MMYDPGGSPNVGAFMAAREYYKWYRKLWRFFTASRTT